MSSRWTSTASAPSRSATALWLIGFLALLPFYGRLEDSGRLWWLWTCMAGVGLGLIGLEYCRRKRRARTEQAAELEG